MTRDFAAWFNRALLEVPDPVTGLPFTNPQIAERVGCSAEKIKTWRQGRTVPGTVEDVAAIAKLLHASQADVLAAIRRKRPSITTPAPRVSSWTSALRATCPA